MTVTNFNALTAEQKTVWSRQVWKQARNLAFTTKFMGKGPNSMIQRITELTKSEKGTRAVITLVADLEEDGVFDGFFYNQKKGDQKMPIAFSNRQDPFSPTPIKNSLLWIQWFELAPGRFEYLVWLT